MEQNKDKDLENAKRTFLVMVKSAINDRDHKQLNDAVGQYMEDTNLAIIPLKKDWEWDPKGQLERTIIESVKKETPENRIWVEKALGLPSKTLSLRPLPIPPAPPLLTLESEAKVSSPR